MKSETKNKLHEARKFAWSLVPCALNFLGGWLTCILVLNTPSILTIICFAVAEFNWICTINDWMAYRHRRKRDQQIEIIVADAKNDLQKIFDRMHNVEEEKKETIN